MKASVSTKLWLTCNFFKLTDVKNRYLALDSPIINQED